MTDKRQRGSFPYPLLDQTDEVGAEFAIAGNPEVQPAGETVHIRLELTLSDQIRTELVNGGPFSLVALWSCTATLQSGIVRLDASQAFSDTILVRISIPLKLIVETVKVSIVMISDKNIPNFRWPIQNPDYGSATFAIAKGDQVGSAGEFSFVARRWFDPMVPPLESCIHFVELTEPEGAFSVNLADDIIKVALPSETYKGFILQANRPLLQQTLFVVPTLMYVLDEMARDDGEHSDKAWFRSLEQLLDARGINGEEPLIAVQKLLDYPATALLTEIATGQEEPDEQ